MRQPAMPRLTPAERAALVAGGTVVHEIDGTVAVIDGPQVAPGIAGRFVGLWVARRITRSC
jgi:hypothetical protein